LLGLGALLGVVLFVSMWLTLRSARDGRLRGETRITAEQLRLRLEAWIDARTAIVSHLAAEVAQWEDPASLDVHFRREASQLVKFYRGFQALNWVDAEGTIRITVPVAGNEGALSQNLFAHRTPGVAEALEAARSDATLHRTPVVPLLQGGSGFGTYLAVRNGHGTLLGFVNGVFRVDALVGQCLTESDLRRDFEFQLHDTDGRIAYGFDRTPALDDMCRTTVRVVNRPWTLCLAPTSAHVAEGETWADEAILVLGLLGTLIVVLLARGRMLRREGLTRSEARYRSLVQDVVDASPMGIVIVDAAGMVVWLNRTQETWFDIPRGRFAGKALESLVAAHLRGGRIEDGKDLARRFREPDVEDAAPKPVHILAEGDRIERWLEHRSAPIERGLFTGGRIHHFHDASRRKHAEAEHDLLAQAIAQAEEMVAIMDRDGSILYVNPAFERHTGYARDEVHGHRHPLLREGSSGAPDDVGVAARWRTIRAGRTWHGRLTRRRKDGTTFDAIATMSPVRDAHGEIGHFVSVTRDVSEQAELEAQVRQSQKMDAVGQLAGGIAHDFNNILQVVIGRGHEALDRALEGEADVRALQQIVEASGRAAQLTKQLLAFGRKQILERHVLDLNEVVADHTGLLRRMIGEDIAIELDLDPDAGRVLADRTQLEQVLMNLCLNARDAMPNGGRIVIRTKRNQTLTPPRGHEMSAGPVGLHGTCFEVIDTGIGIAAASLERVFEPFYSTKQPGHGSGLGLATAYGIVDQHGGVLELTSTPGEGTTARVTLPQVDLPLESGEVPSTTHVAGGTERILVVEDDELVRELAVCVLESAGYRVEVAEDGLQALALVEAHASDLDLVFSDVVMPNLGGRDLRDEILARAPSIRIVLTSGYGEDVLEADGLHILLKPYAPGDLLARVRSALDA